MSRLTFSATSRRRSPSTLYRRSMISRSRFDLLFRQVPNTRVRVDVSLDEDLLARGKADTVDVG